MTQVPAHIQPDHWVTQIFASKTAASGGVVRRQRCDIERIIGWPRFEYEIKRRGFHCFENAGHVLIICNQQPVRVIC